MPRGKGSRDGRAKPRDNACSTYREAWADGGYNRQDSEEDDDTQGGPQPVRMRFSWPVYISLSHNSPAQIVLTGWNVH